MQIQDQNKGRLSVLIIILLIMFSQNWMCACKQLNGKIAYYVNVDLWIYPVSDIFK